YASCACVVADHGTSLPYFAPLSLHDALPIFYDPDRARAVTQAGNVSTWNAFLAALNDQLKGQQARRGTGLRILTGALSSPTFAADRKSTRLNSSHQIISYAVFCLKKKKL